MAAPDAASMEQEKIVREDEPQRNWASLPLQLLVCIFDALITAPVPHPKYLVDKAFHVAALRCTCHAFKDAVNETPIGATSLRLCRTALRSRRGWLRATRATLM